MSVVIQTVPRALLVSVVRSSEYQAPHTDCPHEQLLRRLRSDLGPIDRDPSPQQLGSVRRNA